MCITYEYRWNRAKFLILAPNSGTILPVSDLIIIDRSRPEVKHIVPQVEFPWVELTFGAVAKALLATGL